MEKIIGKLRFFRLSPQSAAARILVSVFLFAAYSIMTAQGPYTEPDFIGGVSTPAAILFVAAFTALQCIVFSFFHSSIRIEKTLLLLASVVFSCAALYNTADAYLFAALCAVEAAVCYYCFTGETVPLIFKNKYITIGAYAALAVLFSAFVGGLTALRYKMYIAPCFDFGIFAQMFASMKKIGLPLTTCERDGLLSHFSVHLSFIYYVILPFYWIFSDPGFLNIAQAVILASGLAPLYLICRDKGLSAPVTLAMGAAYALYPALSAGCFYDIHENCFLTPLILWLMCAMDRDSTVGVALSAALICAVKEDAPVYVIFICIYMFFAKRKALKPALLMGFAGAYFLGAVWYLNRHGDGAMLYRYANYSPDGGSLTDIIKTALENPGYVFAQCLDGEKLEFMLKMLLPLGFLPLISAKMYNYILLGPFMLINLMSNYPYQHSLDFQYNFGTAALLFYLAADNIAGLRQHARRVLAVFCAVASLCGAFAFVGGKATYVSYYRSTAPVCAQIDAVLEQIPADATVSASTFILPHLSEHDVLYQVNGANHDVSGRTEYVVLDLRFEEFRALYPLYTDAGYETVDYTEGAAVLLRCPYYTGETEAS